MIEKPNVITGKDFKIGLFTQSDIVNSDPNLSPNTMDVQWFFDSTIGKRLGSSTSNSVQITSGGGGSSFIIGGALTTNLIAYWKMDEASGVRFDSINANNLTNKNNVTSVTGIRNNAASFGSGISLYVNNDSSLDASGAFSFATWINITSNNGSFLITRRLDASNATYDLRCVTPAVGAGSSLLFEVTATDGSTAQVYSNSFGSINTSTWYNVVCWNSNGSHIGISVNLSVNTAPFPFANASTSGGSQQFIIGGSNTANGAVLNGAIDETGFWSRILTPTDRSNLYAGGSGNTYTSGSDPNAWFSFDFGATGIRWYTVCAGTGIVASSNLAATFVNISTSRTPTFQYMDRSKNVLIMTSDAYDQTLYWAGSAGTSAVALAINSAPKAKFSINYQGFLVLLNSTDSNGTISNRRFSYADENLQLTDPWNNGFDIPSSSDDEITAPFILNKFLYISTKYKIFRLNYTGGNPDWQYIQVKNFGYVPRTVKVFTLKQGQVAVGLDWTRRLRAFDGYDDQIISDNVYSDNQYCEFAMQKISLAGSGLLISNAEFDPNYQEYRLNVAIGAQSTQTTHCLVLNARTLALYPYSNQPFNTICVAQSAGQQFLMAVDRSGYVHIMNSGNMDVATPINEVYDSPLMFNQSPSSVTKNKQINFYFGYDSCGKVYYQEAFDFSRLFSEMKPLRNYRGEEELTGMESSLLILRSLDLPSVQNTYQFRLTSSNGTANPWKLTYFDYLNSQLGYGRGK